MARIALKLYNNVGYSSHSLRTLALAFSSQSRTVYAPTGIQLRQNQWDSKKQMVVRHPDASSLTLKANRILLSAQEVFLRLTGGMNMDIDAKQMREIVMRELNKESGGTKFLINYMIGYMETCSKKSTRSVYNSTISRLKQFCPTINSVLFDNVTQIWLRQFDKWLSEHGCPSVNGRSVHLRNLRTVFNAAIDDGITTNYPFRKFHIRNEKTPDRFIKVESLRAMLNLELNGNDLYARDCFLLSFYLLGINMADLFMLQVSGTKVIYDRQKTGKRYEFRLQPEAQRLLYVLDWVSHYKNTHSFLIMMNRSLNRIGSMVGYPEMTTYYARYTWATIAAQLDIPKETISKALGHSTETVTDTYIAFDHSKVDKANRQVIDYVLMHNK